MKTYKLTVEEKQNIFKSNGISLLHLDFELKNINDNDFMEYVEYLILNK